MSYQDSAEIVNFGIAIYAKEKSVFEFATKVDTKKKCVLIVKCCEYGAEM